MIEHNLLHNLWAKKAIVSSIFQEPPEISRPIKGHQIAHHSLRLVSGSVEHIRMYSLIRILLQPAFL